MLLLFVVLPVLLGVAVVAFVSWRSPSVPPGMRTSDLLERGEVGWGRLLHVRNHATSFLDLRPMVSLTLEVTPEAGGPPFELVVTQWLPRPLISALRPDMTLEVRFAPDRSAGAVVPPTPG